MRKALLLPFLVLIACTYSFNPSLYSHVRSIAIPVFRNETIRYGLAEPLTKALIEAFTRDGTLRVSSEREADSVLEGTIVEYEKTPFIYDEYETVSSFKVTIRIEVEFVDRVRDGVFWRREFEDWGDYPADGQEEDGIDKATEKLKDRLVREIIEGW